MTSSTPFALDSLKTKIQDLLQEASSYQMSDVSLLKQIRCIMESNRKQDEEDKSAENVIPSIAFDTSNEPDDIRFKEAQGEKWREVNNEVASTQPVVEDVLLNVQRKLQEDSHPKDTDTIQGQSTELKGRNTFEPFEDFEKRIMRQLTQSIQDYITLIISKYVDSRDEDNIDDLGIYQKIIERLNSESKEIDRDDRGDNVNGFPIDKYQLHKILIRKRFFHIQHTNLVPNLSHDEIIHLGRYYEGIGMERELVKPLCFIYSILREYNRKELF